MSNLYKEAITMESTAEDVHGTGVHVSQDKMKCRFTEGRSGSESYVVCYPFQSTDCLISDSDEMGFLMELL